MPILVTKRKKKGRDNGNDAAKQKWQAILVGAFGILLLVATLFQANYSIANFKTVTLHAITRDFFLINITNDKTLEGTTARTTTQDGIFSTSTATYSEIVRDELGHPNVEHLPLWEWERNSMNATLRTCKPPHGVSSSCCVGATSKGGGPRWKANECLHADHAASKLWTEKYLENLPYHSGKGCDICEIVDIMARFNWTVAMQGDSVVNQAWGGLECELGRRGFPVGIIKETVPETTENRWRYKFTSIDTMKVNLTSSTSVVFRYYRGYRPGEDLINRTIAENDILVFDHGLHYPPNTAQNDFKKDMTRLMQTIRDQEHALKLVAWRETSAQHFDGKPGGYFLQNEEFYGKCTQINENFTEAAHTNLSLSQNFLDSISSDYPKTQFKNVVDEMANVSWLDVSDAKFLGTPPYDNGMELVYLPYRDYTKQLYYMHDNECTHFCSNPFIWQPIWRGLRLAMQRTAKNYQLAHTFENHGRVNHR